MNSYHNYANWKNKQENKKVKLANWPHHYDPDTLNQPNMPSNRYNIGVVSVSPNAPNATVFGNNPTIDDNTPDLNLDVPAHLISDTFRVLHHLMNAHDAIMPSREQDKAQPHRIIQYYDEDENTDEDTKRELDKKSDFAKYYSSGRPRTGFYTYGKISNEEDLQNHLAHAFSNILLHSLNRQEPILHPGRDHMIETAPEAASYHNPDNDIKYETKHKKEAGSQQYKDNVLVRNSYHQILKDYIKHVLQNPHNEKNFDEYISEGRYPEYLVDFLRQTLKTKKGT